MLMLYNVSKGQIINQSREKKEAKKKADDAQELCQLSLHDLCVKENICFGYRTAANNSLFYSAMKEVWDQDQLLKAI